MKKERIEILIRECKLRVRTKDLQRIESLIESSIKNAAVVKKIAIMEDTATLIFREFYESIRQLGDAMWWSMGYEPAASHEVSMEILMDMETSNKVALRNLDRFRRIRNNANYRGYKVSAEEAEEIAKFWVACSGEIVQRIRKSLK